MKPKKHSFRRYLVFVLCVVLMMSNISVMAYAEGTDSAPNDEISIARENTLPESENNDSSDSGNLDEENADPSADQSPEEEVAAKEPAKETADEQTDTETSGEKSTEPAALDQSGNANGEESAVTEEGLAASGEGTVSSVSLLCGAKLERYDDCIRNQIARSLPGSSGRLYDQWMVLSEQ